MRYAQIRECDVSNGENVGVSLFVQGCPAPHCPNCFNPETWEFNGGKEWTQEVEDKFIELANRPYIKRISILGGEPLAEQNLDGVLNLVNRFRLLCPNKTIWLYTGYNYQKIMRELPNLTTKDNYSMYKRKKIVKMVDILVDGRYIDSQCNPSLKWRGSENQRVIDIQESIKQNKVVLYCG